MLARALAILVLVPALLTPAAVRAADPRDLLPAGVRARLDPVTERIADLRASLGSTSLLSQVAGALGVPPTVTGVPVSTDPIHALAAAVEAAAASIGSLDPSVRRLAVEARGRLAERLGEGLRRDGLRLPRTRLEGVIDAPAPVVAAASRAPQAALLIAAALERSLPMLRSVPRTGSATGCDVVDQLPHLCVGSEADNVYTEAAALLIDLGGDDVYRHAAAAAPFVAEGSPVLHPVSVVVDVAGDDTYATDDQSPALDGLAAAHGAGLFGGLGMLIDLDGDDAYTASVGEGSDVLAQGAGLGGVGLLLDAGGADAYRIEGRDATGDRVSLMGQGAGIFALGNLASAQGYAHSVGAIVDGGEGDDVYGIEAGTVTGPPGNRGIAGQGYALYGVGVIHDDGGTDVFSARASAAQSQSFSRAFDQASAFVDAQGVGFGFYWQPGLGAILAGAGSSTYAIEAASEGIAWNSVSGQGLGALGGAGVIDDLGGDDRYLADVTMDESIEVVVADPCTVLEPGSGDEVPCERAELEVSADGSSVTNAFSGQGFSGGQGLGLIADHGGDDLYHAASEQHLRVTLDDRLQEPSAPPRLDVVGFPTPSLYAQGFAQLGGVGALLDQGGSDRYEARAANEVAAAATSLHAEGEPETAARTTQRAFIGAQAGVDFIGLAGILLDLGGTGDRFDAESRVLATTAPNPDGALTRTDSWPYFQGAFGGVFAALGEAPVIVSRPSRPVCQTSAGRRGFGEWQDCFLPTDDPEHENPDAWPIWSHHTAGLAPGAEGVAPTLSFTEAPASATIGDVIDVAAALRTPSGQAIEGQPLRFSIQMRSANPNDPTVGVLCCWYAHMEAAGVTGPDGIAEARLPTALSHQSCDPCEFRIRLTFDGAEGLYPRQAGRPITLALP